MKLKISEVIKVIETLAPLELAESWDNTGLLYGDPSNETDSLLLTLDITDEAVRMADEVRAGMIVSHHPLIFEPIKRFDFNDPHQKMITNLMRSDTAIYAAHTNLDVCKGGVSDSLADILECDVIDNSLFSDLNTSLRNCVTRYANTVFSLYNRICLKLEIHGCLVNFDTDSMIRNISVSGGSFDSEWTDEVIRRKSDCVITGEMKYHDMVKLAGYGIKVIAVGHAVSERVVLKPLADHISEYLPGLTIAVYNGLDYNKVVS